MFIAGSELGLGYPTITIKTLIQNQRPCPPVSLSTLPTLYRGFPISLLGTLPYKTTLLATHTSLLEHLKEKSPPETSPLMLSTTASAGAAVVASFINCPWEHLMTRQQLTPGLTLKTVFHNVTRGGYAQFYRGWGGTCAREVGYATTVLAGAPALEDHLEKREVPSPISPLVASLATGLGGAALTQPADTLKTLQQSTPLDRPTPKVKTVLSSLTARGGIASLWAGLAPRALRITIGSFVVLTLRRALGLLPPKEN